MSSQGSVVDAATAREFLRAVVPEWEWLIAHIESEKGLLRFPRQVEDLIRSLKIASYPLLYENEASIGAVLARALLEPEELEAFNKGADAASPEERGALIREFLDQLSTLEGAFELPKTPADERRARAIFDALAPEEQNATVRVWQYLMMGFLASFYEHLSVMVHGEKLTALVAQAKAGDRSAFAKAVQIDKRILSEIPYFKERYARAGLESDTEFLGEVARRMSAPPYRGRIRHKSLWLTFAFLQACGLLSTYRHEELLDLCEEVGVGGHKNRIEDVKNLSKRLAEYRGFQERGIASTP